MISSDKAKVHFSGFGDFEMADILRGIYGVIGTCADKAVEIDKFGGIVGKLLLVELLMMGIEAGIEEISIFVIMVDSGMEIDREDWIRKSRKYCWRYVEENKTRIDWNDEGLMEISPKTTMKMVMKFGTKITNSKR